MMVRQIHVLHSSEALVALPPAFEATARAGDALVLHTCQRIMVLTCQAETVARLKDHLPPGTHCELLEGIAAYELLLRLACGLESRLAGETQVFGQLKQCWQVFSQARSELTGHVSGLMQTLCRDVKDIRSRYLTGTGSASYGSLVRRVLTTSTAPAEAPVLLVGAGQLAHSVAPWLEASELWIWNRNADRAAALADQLRRRSQERVVRVLPSTFEAELAAWRAVRDVVVCVPVDQDRDHSRVAAWNHPRDARGRLVHLGFNDVPADGSGHGVWRMAEPLLHLGHMYEMLRASNEQRAAQLEQARRACADKALQALTPRQGALASAVTAMAARAAAGAHSYN
jgi:hypothetical protein